MIDAGPSRKPFDWCLQKEGKNPVGKPREMKFLDINLTKDSSLLLHAIHSPFYWRIKKKPYFSLVLKILQNNPRNLMLFMNSILKKGKMRVENHAKLQSDKTRIYAQKPRPKMLFKNFVTIE
jgi:hypothetical protein